MMENEVKETVWEFENKKYTVLVTFREDEMTLEGYIDRPYPKAPIDTPSILTKEQAITLAHLILETYK